MSGYYLELPAVCIVSLYASKRLEIRYVKRRAFPDRHGHGRGGSPKALSCFVYHRGYVDESYHTPVIIVGRGCCRLVLPLELSSVGVTQDRHYARMTNQRQAGSEPVDVVVVTLFQGEMMRKLIKITKKSSGLNIVLLCSLLVLFLNLAQRLGLSRD